MRRLVLTLVTATALVFTTGACGDDDSGGNGTDTNTGGTDTNTGGTDTNTGGSDTSAATDTTTGTDTNTGGTDTTQPGDCQPNEVGTVALGGACTRDCECSQAEGNSSGLETPNFCYSGAYMSGFSFCTRSSEGELNLEVYKSILLTPSCFATDPGGESNTRVYVKTCTQLSDCKALASQYTHCGTGDLTYTNPGARGTECVDQSSNCTNKTMTTGDTCIINTLPPFAEAEAKCP